MPYSLINDLNSDLFEFAERVFGSPRREFSIAENGLKSLIHRPHNLFTVKDKNGNIEKYKIQVVYTPFKKDDIKVTVSNNTIVVTIGFENKSREDDLVYCGISHQSYKFSLPLADTSIDPNKVSAKTDDGILTIEMPVKESEKPTTINIKVD